VTEMLLDKDTWVEVRGGKKKNQRVTCDRVGVDNPGSKTEYVKGGKKINAETGA